MSHNHYTPKKAMVIVAHPDDIEYGCAGTVAQWVQDGAEVCYVLCTSGDVGISEAGMTCARAAKIREAEQLAAATVIGVKDVVFLREPDGLLENTIALRKKLVREIRRFKPDVVITEDPTLYWGDDQQINHPDHRAAGGAAIDAIFPAAGQPNLFEELAHQGFTAHKVRKVYVRDYYKGMSFVDISHTIELQIEALKKHVSQIEEWDPAPSVREWAATTGKRAGLTYAESYRIITLISDKTGNVGGMTTDSLPDSNDK